jgi:hypothetical protein
MHQSDSRMRALIGLWILAGLMVVGVNGTMLLSLLDEPLAGYSSGVRNADRAFRQYRMRLTAETEKMTSGMKRLTSWFDPVVVEEEQPLLQKTPTSPSLAKKMAHPKVVLPTLNGIMTSRSSDGSTRRLALLDGRICAQGAPLGDFTVKRIARGGVSLAQGDRVWYLKAPDVAYSIATQ